MKGGTQRKRTAWAGIVFLMILTLVVSACGGGTDNGGNGPGPHSPGNHADPDGDKPPQQPPPAKDPLEEQIQSMSLTEKIGQMIVAGVNGPVLDEATAQLLTGYQIGGVILYSKDMENIRQTVALLNELKKTGRAASPNDIPLFLSVDQEGGLVSRLPAEFAELPDHRAIGDSGDEQKARKAGEIIGKQLGLLGFNLNYAPVLDVNSNPDNPVIGRRSFGSEPDIVARMGIPFMKGLQAQKIIPAVKHFPGHGDTGVDSHLELPVVRKSLHDLQALELVPFRQAIQNGADMIMAAHILLPAIDSEWPSSMSRTILTDLLRHDLGFEGVVITDDMTMGAIAEHFAIDEAAVQAVLAGADIVMVAHGSERAANVAEALRTAVESGAIPEQRIDESVGRILRLKQKYDLANESVEIEPFSRMEEKIEEINQETGDL